MENNQSEIAKLQERTKKLERQLKLTIAILITSFGVLFVSAWSWNNADEQKFDKIRVRQITVVDEKGAERIYIGSPIPLIVDGKYVERKAPSTGIAMTDGNGNEINGWGIFPDGTQNFCLDYPKGRGEALCLSQGGDRAGMIIKDKNQRFSMLLGRIGYNEAEPKLFLSDSTGRTRIKLQAESEDGTPKLEIVDKNGKSVFVVSEPAAAKSK